MKLVTLVYYLYSLYFVDADLNSLNYFSLPPSKMLDKAERNALWAYKALQQIEHSKSNAYWMNI